MESPPPPRRQTKKEQQSEASIEAILQAAKYLFVTKGFHGTRIDDIASRVGLTKGAVYFHFEDKIAILKVLLDRVRNDILDPLAEKLGNSTESPSERLMVLLSHGASIVSKDPIAVLLPIVIAIEFKATDDGIGKYVHAGYQRLARMLEHVLQEGIAAGEFRSDISAREQAYVLVALNDGMMLTWLRNNKNLDGITFLRQVRSTLWHAISAPGLITKTAKRNAELPSVELPVIE